MRKPISKGLYYDLFLGIECKIAVPGKVEEYLLQNSKSHYEQLVKTGYFIDRAMLDQHG